MVMKRLPHLVVGKIGLGMMERTVQMVMGATRLAAVGGKEHTPTHTLLH